MTAVFFSFAASLAQEASPDAGQLLKRVRQGATLQENKDIKGQIRKRSVKIPFSMSLRGNLIAFQYQLNNVWNRFDLKFKDRGQEILSRPSRKGSPGRTGKPVFCRLPSMRCPLRGRT